MDDMLSLFLETLCGESSAMSSDGNYDKFLSGEFLVNIIRFLKF